MNKDNIDEIDNKSVDRDSYFESIKALSSISESKITTEHSARDDTRLKRLRRARLLDLEQLGVLVIFAQHREGAQS